MLARVVLALALAAGVNAECPNACSGHGDCGAFDMCTCYRNFQGADCSERTCPFGKAHVDSPKGDLDSSATALSTGTVIQGSTVYPDGTEELFPAMLDSSGASSSNTAHYYMECSNKGICERKDGVCECFEGYEGSACQRASCPNDCSGHGTCEHIETIAALEYGNMYELWDEGMTMGCVCDAGFSGADCSSRDCKYGIDPLYVDDEASARVEEITYKMTDSANDGTMSGTYALKFYDVFGEDYTTEPITVGAGCTDITSALESLPNTVIPTGSVVCTDGSTAVTGAPDTDMYSLQFTGNPGYLKQLFVDTYLDGARTTVAGTGTDDPATIVLPTTGVSGSFMDYFAARCEGVEVTFAGSKSTSTVSATFQDRSGTSGPASVADVTGALKSGFTLSFASTAMEAYLKKCLGDSDGDDTYASNVEVYDWDYGSYVSTSSSNSATSVYSDTANSIDDMMYVMSSHPHAIKLVDTTAGDFDAGKYYLTWFEADATNPFVVANPPADSTGTYYVYTTDGVVERVIDDQTADGQASPSASFDDQPPITAYFTEGTNVIYTSKDTACETSSGIEPCLDKGDLIFVIDSSYLSNKQDPTVATDAATGLTAPSSSVDTGGLYEIKKIYVADPTSNTATTEDRFRIVTDKSLAFTSPTAVTTFDEYSSVGAVGIVNIFKFSPATTGNYEFVSQCSNRGSCVDGVCECYKGYTNDNCDTQSAYAI